MAYATLRIAAFDAALGGFPIELIEKDGPQTSGSTPAAALSTGRWTVSIDKAVPVPATDVVTKVLQTPGAERGAINWSEIGQALFELLVPPGPIRDRWKKIAVGSLYLDIQAEALEAVPWELAITHAPELRLAINHALSRLHSAPDVGHLASSAWPFRVLILVGCSAPEEKELEVDAEIQMIRRVFLPFGRSVDLRVERTPTRAAFTKLIRGATPYDSWHPHVLHFVGHAGERAGGSVGLKINRSEFPDNESWVWTEGDVQGDLNLLGWIPEFVFLNACRTAAEGAGAWSMQRSFARAGSKCVLTMQADVLGSLAGIFANELYQRLVKGEPVQEAARQARAAVRDRQGGGSSIDWALPSVTASQPALTLFTPRKTPNDPHFEDCEEFRQARIFANCQDGRRILTHWLCPAKTPPQAQAGPPNVMLLTGEAHCGKSHLLKWVMESWVLSGARVRYIEIHDNIPKNFLTILRQIRDGDVAQSNRYLQQSLPGGQFKRFNWELNNLLRTGQAGEWDAALHPEASIADEGLPVAARGESRLEPIVCAAFHAALKEVAQQQPLVLVFDKLSANGERMLSPDDFKQLLDYLFKPIAAEPHSLLKLVFSVNPAEETSYGFSRLQAHPLAKYRLPDTYPDTELVELAAEMLWFNQEAGVADTIRQLAAALFRLPPGEVPWRGLARLKTVLSVLPPVYLNQMQRMQ